MLKKPILGGDPMRRHLGPKLPEDLIGRVGGFVTAHHVCKNYVLYTNMLSQKSHIFRKDHGEKRWKWVNAYDNSDDAGRDLRKMLRGIGSDPPAAS